MHLQFVVAPKSKRLHFEGAANVYRAIGWIFGFKEKYSLTLSTRKRLVAIQTADSDFRQ
jgi:hypothetical protein